MSEPLKEIINGYQKIRPLGKGSYGEAFLVEHVESRIRYAMKILPDDIDHDQDITEVEFLQIANHPFIIKYINHFPYPDSFRGGHCIVMEIADGCDLRSKMVSMKNLIQEKLALNWFTHICLALLKMHSKGIIHRDIKPENILIVGDVSGGIAKLGDFGTVKHIDIATHLSSKVGTPLYFAPERMTKKYSYKSDVWSLGVILFELLSGGVHPFQEEGTTKVQYIVSLQKLKLKQLPDDVSEGCKNLVNKLLTKNQKQRPTIQEVLKEPLIQEKIRLIINEYVNGEQIQESIRQQLLQTRTLCCLPTLAPQRRSSSLLRQQQPRPLSKILLSPSIKC
ncbi:hypothetical protein FGO68_gene7232 [Halteria grandinella]|uniref:non-specific serine/threonine protein kinase n=1 Tax=Halteria grandinella TaxID=5974 RepID=A0A8J8P168_HALGN|nr:hypothetical protein FGO68_gene7232 [Halteria grandinella]